MTMGRSGRLSIDGVATRARAYRAWAQAAVARALAGVGPEARRRLRDHGIAIVCAAAATIVTLATGLGAAGPFLLADVVVAAAAWLGGLSTGAVAALAAVLAARLTAVPLSGLELEAWPALLLAARALAIAAVSATLAAKGRTDEECVSGLERHIQRLEADARRQGEEFSEVRVSTAEAHAQLQSEVDVARQQLTMLQSVTDPALNALDGPTLVTSLLERVCAALGADGVALYHLDGCGGRIFAASQGLRPLGAGREPRKSDYRTGRAALIHNDARRVADASLCRWPDDVTSLIAVPAVHGKRLQLVIEVANRRAKRSTEWELALIQVVAERAAGSLRETSGDADAVA